MKKSRGVLTFCAVFIAPGALLYLVFVIVPIFMTASYTFFDWNAVKPMTWNHFANYLEMVVDVNFWKISWNNLRLVLLGLLLQMPTGLILAFLVSRIRIGYKIFRSILFLPVVIAASVTGIMFSVLLNDKVGPLNLVMDAIGLGAFKRLWLSDPQIVLYSVALPQLWQYIGTDFIIFLAAIQSLPEEVLESAKIDGITSPGMLIKIVVPMINDIIQIMVVLTVTGCLQAFDHAYVMTTGGPGISSTYLAMYVYRVGFKESRFGYASGIALSMLVLALAFTVIYKRFSKNSDY